MFETIWKWYSENYPKAVILLVFGTLVFLGTRFITQWENRLIQTETTCKKIEIKLDDVSKSIEELRISVHSILVYLKSKDASIDVNSFRGKNIIAPARSAQVRMKPIKGNAPKDGKEGTEKLR